ncbi:MAG: FAD binding domain-containing protein [Actinomycetes bacterium]
MKPSPFTYHAPRTVEATLVLLDGLGDHAKVLAGGQSLLPLLSMRLAAPEHLVDINRVVGLDRLEVSPAGVRVGALVRHARLESDPEVAEVLPLLGRALRQVAHPTIRNRGTTVGSLVHADPAAEMPAVLVLLGGSVELASATGIRTVAAEEFFRGPLEADLRPGELATSAWFPATGPATGTAFLELSRRHGDYALVGLAAAVDLDDQGRIASARVAYLSVGPTPILLDLTAAVSGATPGGADWAGAGALAAEQVDPDSDVHADAAYRRHLVRVLTARGSAHAAADATARSSHPPQEAQ